MNILLQILDDGMVTDAQGRRINFENTIVIMTSNAGSDGGSGSLGFGHTPNERDKDKAMKALQEFLRPEFINRVDEIIAFNHLTEDNFKDIARLMLGELKESMAEHAVELVWDESLLDYLTKKSFSIKYGARNLRRLIQKEIEDKIAEKIILSYEDPIKHVALSARGETLDITAE